MHALMEKLFCMFYEYTNQIINAFARTQHGCSVHFSNFGETTVYLLIPLPASVHPVVEQLFSEPFV